MLRWRFENSVKGAIHKLSAFPTKIESECKYNDKMLLDYTFLALSMQAAYKKTDIYINVWLNKVM